MSDIGEWVSERFGSANKGNQGKYAMPAPEVDSNAYQYGGQPGGADAAANRYQQQAQAAQGRQGPQVNYAQADTDRAMGHQARVGQNQMATLLSQRARGITPSIAQMQADRQMQQATAAQASQAASARGPAALALAQQNAANNTANMQGAISGQAQINAANERLAAEQAAFGAYSGMRGGDLASQQQAAQQQQFQSGLNMQQRGLNDQMTLGMTGYEHGVRTSQLNAQMNEQAQRSANAIGAGQINAGVSGQNAATNQQNSMGFVGMATSAALPFIPKAKGGPVAGGEPYLVGERGPELVVPSRDGVVVPAEQTRALLSGRSAAPSTWGTRGPDLAAQQNAVLEQQLRGAAGREMVRQAESTESPWERDARQVGALRRAAPELVSEDDVNRERRSRAVLSSARREKASSEGNGQKAAPKASTPEQAKKATIGDFVGRMGKQLQEQASRVDVGYHGPSGAYAPPVLLQARANGGPMTAGNPYLVGEQGPEMVMPVLGQRVPSYGGGTGGVDIGANGGMSADMVKAASTGLAGNTGGIRGMVGGGGITGGAVKLGTPGGFGGMRADGGPVEAGTAYTMGERGPEMVLPLSEPEGYQLHQGDDGRAFYRAIMSMGAPHDGRPSLAGETPRYSVRAPLAKAKGPSKAKSSSKAVPDTMSYDELMRLANRMGGEMQSTHDARMAQGPAARRLASGTPESGYTTELTPAAEQAFERWRQQTSPWDTGEDYDLRGAFADSLERDNRPGEVGHLPDTYKKPNHETFSDESTYARYEPESAGSWRGERYARKGPPLWLRREMTLTHARPRR